MKGLKGYGYVVFTEQTSAKSLLKSQLISLAGGQVQVSRMDKSFPQMQGGEVGTVQKAVREARTGLEMNIVGGKASVVIKVTNKQAGIIVGSGGNRIKNLEKKCGAKINIPKEKSNGMRTVTIYGPQEAVEMAQVEVNNILRSMISE